MKEGKKHPKLEHVCEYVCEAVFCRMYMSFHCYRYISLNTLSNGLGESLMLLFSSCWLVFIMLSIQLNLFTTCLAKTVSLTPEEAIGGRKNSRNLDHDPMVKNHKFKY